MTSNGFALTVTVTPGASYAVQVSTNLQSWSEKLAYQQQTKQRLFSLTLLSAAGVDIDSTDENFGKKSLSFEEVFKRLEG